MKDKIKYIILAVVILIIIVGVILIVKKSNKTTPAITDYSDYDGVYTLGENSFNIRFTAPQKFYFIFNESDSQMSGYITIENGVGKSSLFDNKITFTFNKDKTVSITADKNSKLNGKYSKTGEYSDDVYYKDIVGDKTYLTKEINGKYLKEVEVESKDKNETNESERTEEINMYVIQTSKNKGSLIIPDGNIISVYVDFEISPDNQLKGINPNTNVNDFFLITFTSDGFEFTSKEMNLESYNGKYIRKSGLTQQEVIDIITPK